MRSDPELPSSAANPETRDGEVKVAAEVKQILSEVVPAIKILKNQLTAIANAPKAKRQLVDDAAIAAAVAGLIASLAILIAAVEVLVAVSMFEIPSSSTTKSEF